MGLTRAAAVAVTVYHFEKEKLDFATGSTMMGYTTGLALFPSMTSYIFEHFGFSHAMLIFTPFMMLHFLGVGTYSQTQRGLMGCNQTVDSTLRKSLLQIAHNGRVGNTGMVLFLQYYCHQLDDTHSSQQEHRLPYSLIWKTVWLLLPPPNFFSFY